MGEMVEAPAPAEGGQPSEVSAQGTPESSSESIAAECYNARSVMGSGGQPAGDESGHGQEYELGSAEHVSPGGEADDRGSEVQDKPSGEGTTNEAQDQAPTSEMGTDQPVSESGPESAAEGEAEEPPLDQNAEQPASDSGAEQPGPVDETGQPESDDAAEDPALDDEADEQGAENQAEEPGVEDHAEEPNPEDEAESTPPRDESVSDPENPNTEARNQESRERPPHRLKYDPKKEAELARRQMMNPHYFPETDFSKYFDTRSGTGPKQPLESSFDRGKRRLDEMKAWKKKVEQNSPLVYNRKVGRQR